MINDRRKVGKLSHLSSLFNLCWNLAGQAVHFALTGASASTGTIAALPPQLPVPLPLPR